MNNSSGLQLIFDRIETGERLSKRELKTLMEAVQSQQITIATGDRSVAIGGSANGAVIVTGDRNLVINGANAEAIRELMGTRPRNEKLLLKAVKDEVAVRLEQSLHKAVMIQLGMKLQPEQIKSPWASDIKIGGKPSEPIPENWTISRVFDEVKGKLLILGAPGSGKTTTLLDLAQALIERSEQQPDYPIPVLFNLSSWKDNKLTINDWLITELKSKYGISLQPAQKWLEERKLLPLLDGLDELEAARQELCVLAINQFLKSQYRPAYLVVCSRHEEYTVYTTNLSLNGAICLQMLTKKQLKQYFINIGYPQIWQIVAYDIPLLELIRVPLLLSITILIHQEINFNQWGRLVNTEQRLNYLMFSYIEHMLSRDMNSAYYNRKKLPRKYWIKQWLIWLAKYLENEKKDEFLIEDLKLSCLKNHQKRVNVSLNLLLSGFYSLFLGMVAGATIEFSKQSLFTTFDKLLAGLRNNTLLDLPPFEIILNSASKVNIGLVSGLIIGCSIFLIINSALYGLNSAKNNLSMKLTKYVFSLLTILIEFFSSFSTGIFIGLVIYYFWKDLVNVTDSLLRLLDNMNIFKTEILRNFLRSVNRTNSGLTCVFSVWLYLFLKSLLKDNLNRLFDAMLISGVSGAIFGALVGSHWSFLSELSSQHTLLESVNETTGGVVSGILFGIIIFTFKLKNIMYWTSIESRLELDELDELKEDTNEPDESRKDTNNSEDFTAVTLKPILNFFFRNDISLTERFGFSLEIAQNRIAFFVDWVISISDGAIFANTSPADFIRSSRFRNLLIPIVVVLPIFLAIFNHIFLAIFNHISLPVLDQEIKIALGDRSIFADIFSTFVFLGFLLLFLSLHTQEMVTKISPNQGVWRTAKNATIIASILTVLLSFDTQRLFGDTFHFNQPLFYVFSISLLKFNLIWLLSGGWACIQHFALRLVLFRSGLAPWNYAQFLNYCTERLLLQRVGGRYRFIHQFFRNHFSAMPLEKE